MERKEDLVNLEDRYTNCAYGHHLHLPRQCILLTKTYFSSYFFRELTAEEVHLDSL